MQTRTLVILRHAKAVTPDGMVDVSRPLTSRGRADAAAAGRWLVEHGHLPDLVLCSPARRTRETWHGVAGELTKAPAVHYVDAVYAAAPDDLLAAVAGADPDAATLLLIGHNPGVSQLSALLDPSAGAGLRTAGLAVHRWDGDWTDGGTAPAPLVEQHTARA